MSKYHAAILIVPAAIALAGFFVPETRIPEPVAARDEALGPPVRVTLDLARGRRWELHWDAVLAYDIASGNLSRRIRLPGAVFAGDRDSCPPDMLLSRSGALIVSSNAQPRLWRISPARFEVEVYDIALQTDADKDIGFGDLEWGRSESVLLASASPAGVPWRIDLGTGSAMKLAPSIATRGPCGLR